MAKVLGHWSSWASTDRGRRSRRSAGPRMEAQLRRARLLIVHVETLATDAVGADRPGLAGAALLRIERDEQRGRWSRRSSSKLRSVVGASVSEEMVRIGDAARVIALGIDLTRSRASHGVRGALERPPRPFVRGLPQVGGRGGGSRVLVPGARPQITVGWTDNHTADRALAVAAEEAHLRGSALIVLTVPPAREPGPGRDHRPADPRRGAPRVRDRPRDSLPGPSDRRRPPDRRRPAGVDRDGSQPQDCLVLGCHRSNQPWSIRTGPVAEAVMRAGHCPVMLVGRQAKQPDDGACPVRTAVG